MWYKILNVVDWFGELGERVRVVRDFNRAAKMAFIQGQAPTLLQAKTTKGDFNYKHAFSKWMAGGFRIKALSGSPLPKKDLIEISKVILDNNQLVRKLVALGWDTLEVHDNKGFQGVKFPLKDYANIGGYLS
ncbi:MAG: hypothetical protein ACI8Q1_002208 [Parvicella sp.]|jgi:hypothetical protein